MGESGHEDAMYTGPPGVEDQGSDSGKLSEDLQGDDRIFSSSHRDDYIGEEVEGDRIQPVVGGYLHVEEVFQIRRDVVQKEKLPETVEPAFFPPCNLFGSQAMWPDNQLRRTGGFPVTDEFDQSEVKNEIREPIHDLFLRDKEILKRDKGRGRKVVPVGQVEVKTDIQSMCRITIIIAFVCKKGEFIPELYEFVMTV